MLQSPVSGRPFTLRTQPRWLVAAFGSPWNVLSWTLGNGGFQKVSEVAWLFLKPDELASVASPVEWMHAEMRAAGLAGAVGFLTSRREHAWVETEAAELDAAAWAVATVGLSNALRAGDPTGPIHFPGTINLLLCSSVALSTAAALEFLALASEAKALAVLDSGVPSRRTGAPASGTGTDYIAVAWPDHGERAAYAGKHTAIGSAAGRAAHAAVAEGVRRWLDEQR